MNQEMVIDVGVEAIRVAIDDFCASIISESFSWSYSKYNAGYNTNTGSYSFIYTKACSNCFGFIDFWTMDDEHDV